MNRRQFLHPFVDTNLLPTRSWSSLSGWLGYINAALAGGMINACGGSAPSTAPTTTSPPPTPGGGSKLQPVSTVIASNGTMASLRHFGYATADRQPLLDAMRTQLEVRKREVGYGAGTWEIPGGAPYGWIFCAGNQFFSDVDSLKLNNEQLWGAYEKQSIG